MSQSSQTDGCIPGLVRAYWMFGGNILVLVLAAYVARRTAPLVTDVLYLFAVLALIAARWVDVSRFKGETLYSVPATPSDWRRYSIGVALVSAALWAVARFAGAKGWV